VLFRSYQPHLRLQFIGSDIFVGVHTKCAHARTYKRREEIYLVMPRHRLGNTVMYLKETDWEGVKYHTHYFKRFQCTLCVHACMCVNWLGGNRIDRER
jgi:hypothetical protein